MTAIQVNKLSKTFNTQVLNDVSFNVEKGELLALIGPSGSGKSTLMRHISGLVTADKNTQSAISVCGDSIQSEGKLAKNVRASRVKIGCIFQQFNLVNRLSVLTNVLIGTLGSIPAWRGYLSIFTEEEKQRALEALDRVGLREHAYKKAAHLSGGQQQRVAIARALMQEADVILADEPIASLDPRSARVVMDMLEKINQKDGKTVIVTLHQVDVARKYCPRIIALREGSIFFNGAREQLTDEVMFSLYEEEAKEMLNHESPEISPIGETVAAAG